MKKENIALGLSGIAVLISISCCFIKIEPVSYDYMGILIGVLSLLVTILLGWQIYSAIYIKDSLRKEVLDSSKEMVAVTKNTLLKSQLNTLYGLHEGALRAGDINYMMSSLDVMMDIAIDLRDKEMAIRIINKMPQLYRILSILNLRDVEKEKYNELRLRIKEFSKITEKAFDIYEQTGVIE